MRKMKIVWNIILSLILIAVFFIPVLLSFPCNLPLDRKFNLPERNIMLLFFFTSQLWFDISINVSLIWCLHFISWLNIEWSLVINFMVWKNLNNKIAKIIIIIKKEVVKHLLHNLRVLTTKFNNTQQCFLYTDKNSCINFILIASSALNHSWYWSEQEKK